MFKISELKTSSPQIKHDNNDGVRWRNWRSQRCCRPQHVMNVTWCLETICSSSSYQNVRRTLRTTNLLVWLTRIHPGKTKKITKDSTFAEASGSVGDLLPGENIYQSVSVAIWDVQPPKHPYGNMPRKFPTTDIHGPLNGLFLETVDSDPYWHSRADHCWERIFNPTKTLIDSQAKGKSRLRFTY